MEKKSEINPTKGWRLYPEFFELFEIEAMKARHRNRRVRQLDCVHAALLAWSMMPDEDKDAWLTKALSNDPTPVDQTTDPRAKSALERARKQREDADSRRRVREAAGITRPKKK